MTKFSPRDISLTRVYRYAAWGKPGTRTDHTRRTSNTAPRTTVLIPSEMPRQIGRWLAGLSRAGDSFNGFRYLLSYR